MGVDYRDICCFQLLIAGTKRLGGFGSLILSTNWKRNTYHYLFYFIFFATYTYNVRRAKRYHVRFSAKCTSSPKLQSPLTTNIPYHMRSTHSTQVDSWIMYTKEHFLTILCSDCLAFFSDLVCYDNQY